MSAPEGGARRRPDGAPWRNFHGRRHGKTLRARQARLLEDLLPRLALPGVGWDENPDRAPLDPSRLFPGARDLWLEIGFGGGEHLAHQARANPDVGLIGAEPFVNGVAMLLATLDEDPAPNLRLHMGDARDLLDVLPAGSVGRVFVLYPDPWPKTRHVERRFIGPDNLTALARVMRPGAVLRLATDIDVYVAHALAAVRAHPAFATVAGGPEDRRRPWPDWPGTRYEAKALREGRRPTYLTFERLPDDG